MTTSPPARSAGTAPDLALSRLSGDLNRQWRLDYADRPAPPAWASDPRLAGCRTAAEALGELERASTAPERVEQLLAALAERAAAADEVAARVVVQYLLPCLLRVAFARRGGVQATVSEAIDELVTAAWEAASTGVELRGRPVKIALLRTIEHRALRQPARVRARLAQREVLVGDGWWEGHTAERDERLVADLAGRPVAEPANAGEELVGVLAEAAVGGGGSGPPGNPGRFRSRLSMELYAAAPEAADRGVAAHLSTERSVRRASKMSGPAD